MATVSEPPVGATDGESANDGTGDEPAVDRGAVQRKTLATLMAGQAFGGASVSSAVAVAGLLAADMLGSDRLVGISSAMLTFGAAFASVPLSRMMRAKAAGPACSCSISSACSARPSPRSAGRSGCSRCWSSACSCSASVRHRTCRAATWPPISPSPTIGPDPLPERRGSARWERCSVRRCPTPRRTSAKWLGLDRYVGPFLFSTMFFGFAA